MKTALQRIEHRKTVKSITRTENLFQLMLTEIRNKLPLIEEIHLKPLMSNYMRNPIHLIEKPITSHVTCTVHYQINANDLF